VSRIPEQTLQQIIAATDVVTLIGRYVKLRKAGANYVGLCPFHTERTGSFNVYPHNGSYYCFGCGEGGTSITFVMKQEGLQFAEAARRLADAAGIQIQEEVWDPQAEREAKERGLLKRIHEELAQWYHELLLKSPMADAARQYLKGRGINSAVAKNWQMGYAPRDGRVLRQWSREHGYNEQQLLAAGILRQGERGLYQHLYHRLMFPVRSEVGEVIAFSGRLLEPDGKGGKYVNSPETPLFNKSRTLFGFDKAKKAISKQGYAIVVEGQIDLIMAYENGFQNVTAGLGTAFTEAHAKMLHRICSEVVLCYDADNAGFKAAERAYKILSPEGIVVKVATLPKGEDPDSLIRKQGKESFQQLISSAADFLDFQITHKRAMLGNDLRHQVALIDQTALSIAMSPSVSARDLMIRSHAAQLGIGEDALRKQVQLFVRRQQTQKKDAANVQQQNAQDAAPNPVEEAKKMLQMQQPLALQLTQMALRSDEVLDWLRYMNLPATLQDIPGCELLLGVVQSTAVNMAESGAAAFISTQPDAQQRAYVQILAKSYPAENAEVVLDTLCRQGLASRIQRARQRIREQLVEGEDLVKLQAQIQAWTRQLNGDGGSS
jgi:DNA primase